MKNVLITGADKFIGERFVSLYKKKYKITAPTDVDFANYEAAEQVFADNRFDVVIHVYGKRNAFNREPLSATDISAYKNVQHLCVLNSVNKLLVISDVSDIDCGNGTVNVTEDEFEELVPKKGYGVGRHLISSLALLDKVSTVLRFFDVYGGGASVNGNTPMGVLKSGILGKKQIEISANRRFSTVFIDDACKIISLFIDKDYEQGIYNVCSPAPVTLYDFAKKAKSFARKEGRDLALVLYSGEENELTGDNAKLMAALGSFKFTSFNTGVAKTLEYCKAHKSCLRDTNDD